MCFQVEWPRQKIYIKEQYRKKIDIRENVYLRFTINAGKTRAKKWIKKKKRMTKNIKI